MRKIYFILSILILLSVCKKEINYSDLQKEDIENPEFDSEKMDITDNDDVQKYLDATGDYPDGTYCAEVEYYNPNTGTRSSYDLDVEVENGDLSVIHWANSGWLDSTHFTPENISSGEVQFTSDRGYRYTVTLGDFGGGCYSGSTRLQNDVNDDIEQEETIKAEETCPECGFSKFSTEDLCSSCKRKVTCPECGGRKDKYEDLCYSCEANKEEDKE